MPLSCGIVNNLVVMSVLLPACNAPSQRSAPPDVSSARSWKPQPADGVDAALDLWGDRWRPANPWAGPTSTPPRGPLPPRTVAEAVGATAVAEAAIATDRGEALTDRLRDFSLPDRQQFGVSLLTVEELLGDGESAGLCEFPELQYSFREDDTRYEADLLVYPYSVLINDPEPMLVEISSGCVDGIAATGGDIEAAEDSGACAEDEVRTFFAEGACRTCVEASGDYAACNTAGSCPDEAPLAVWTTTPAGDVAWYRGVYATAWACAPDYTTPFYILADYGEDGELPAAYDHDAWAYVCTPFWDEASGSAQILCQGAEEPSERLALAEGIFGYVGYLRPEGSDTLAWRARHYYVDRVGVDNGATLSWFLATNPGLGAASAPRLIADTDGDGTVSVGDDDYGYGSGGMGFNPGETRPDGEGMARDWLAAITLKTATTIDGVEILPFQTNRCAAWDGPAADDSYRCTDVTVPAAGWINDLYVTWSDTDRTRAVAFPLTTLGSTGMIDPDVPGGIVTHIAGTSALANPDWDACTLPHQFTPDVAPVEDTPLGYDGVAALDAQTWRFDDRELDLRVVLNTNRARGWCGGTAEGGSRSIFDE